MRTFSKGYGLAGLRVGYALAAPVLVKAFDKVRNHFGMGRVAQAGAMAALADQAFLHDVQAKVAAARDLRMPGVAPLDRCIRISVGTASDLDILAEVLPQALAAAG